MLLLVLLILRLLLVLLLLLLLLLLLHGLLWRRGHGQWIGDGGALCGRRLALAGLDGGRVVPAARGLNPTLRRRSRLAIENIGAARVASRGCWLRCGWVAGNLLLLLLLLILRLVLLLRRGRGIRGGSLRLRRCRRIGMGLAGRVERLRRLRYGGPRSWGVALLVAGSCKR